MAISSMEFTGSPRVTNIPEDLSPRGAPSYEKAESLDEMYTQYSEYWNAQAKHLGPEQRRVFLEQLEGKLHEVKLAIGDSSFYGSDQLKRDALSIMESLNVLAAGEFLKSRSLDLRAEGVQKTFDRVDDSIRKSSFDDFSFNVRVLTGATAGLTVASAIDVYNQNRKMMTAQARSAAQRGALSQAVNKVAARGLLLRVIGTGVGAVAGAAAVLFSPTEAE